MTSVVNKPTQEILAGIIKTDLSNHFPIFMIDNNTKTTNYPNEIKNETRQINDTNISSKCKSMLHETDWMVVVNTYDPNFAYDLFLKQFFPFRTITIKSLDNKRPFKIL